MRLYRRLTYLKVGITGRHSVDGSQSWLHFADHGCIVLHIKEERRRLVTDDVDEGRGEVGLLRVALVSGHDVHLQR